jgi:beta-galactosidase/beta-glucuronidase
MAFYTPALAALAATCATQATDDPTAAPRLQVCLNGEWSRHTGGDVSSVPETGWEIVRVPEDPFSVAKGSAWFRLDFEVPERFGQPGQRVLLRFARVRHYARVFVNGRQCGDNYSARAPFEVDITRAVRAGDRNRLDVWVHDCSGAYAAPGKTIEDPETLKRLSTLEGYREQATIAEDVFLLAEPELHVADVLVMPSVREGKLSVRLSVANASDRDRSVRLTSRVVLGDREVLRFPPTTTAVAAGQTVSVELSQPWANPRLWGYPPYGEPALYHLETKLGDEDRLVTRFGFREVWTDGDRMVLNGKDLKVLGYWGPEGSGRSVWTLRMAAIQSAGCNAIHNHAEQREPSFYDVADEMGLLVWDAGYCGGPLGTTANMSDAPFPDVLPELERQYPLWAKTVANHPSVVLLMMECLYNEEAAVRLGEAYRSVDPTRLIHRGGGMVRPMDLAAYASNFEMNEPDPSPTSRAAGRPGDAACECSRGGPCPW